MRGIEDPPSILERVPDFHANYHFCPDDAFFPITSGFFCRHGSVTTRVDTPVFEQLGDQLEIDPSLICQLRAPTVELIGAFAALILTL